MLPSWCEDTVTVLRAPMVERRGVAVPDWGSATTHTVRGCSLQEGTTTTEFDTSQRNATESDATLLMPPAADVRDGDRISMGGRTWEVSGVPYDMRSPTGATSHRRASLKQWRG